MKAEHEVLKVAALQMVSMTQVSHNLVVAEKLITEAAKKNAKVVVLPEFFAAFNVSSKKMPDIIEQHLSGKIQNFLSAMASKYNLWIVGGSIAIDSGNLGKPFNRCYVYSDLGECVGWYDKIHLFDVDVADSVGRYLESDTCTPGKKAFYFDSGWGRSAIGVCYDIRFPELFRQLPLTTIQTLFIPAAFTAKTGKAHWDILLKARAVENQCYLVAAAQGGIHEKGRETWGHSCIISPWGKVLATAQSGEAVVIAELDFAKQEKIRKEFPVLAHTCIQ